MYIKIAKIRKQNYKIILSIVCIYIYTSIIIFLSIIYIFPIGTNLYGGGNLFDKSADDPSLTFVICL